MHLYTLVIVQKNPTYLDMLIADFIPKILLTNISLIVNVLYILFIQLHHFFHLTIVFFYIENKHSYYYYYLSAVKYLVSSKYRLKNCVMTEIIRVLIMFI